MARDVTFQNFYYLRYAAHRRNGAAADAKVLKSRPADTCTI